MNKEEYLKKLEQCLKKYLSKEEVNDILMDYGEYFEDGRRQNKSDTEISAKLGDPEVIASQFIDEVKAENSKKYDGEIERLKDSTKSFINNIKGEGKEKKNKSVFNTFGDFIGFTAKAILFLIVFCMVFGIIVAVLGALGGGVFGGFVVGVVGVLCSIMLVGNISVFAVIFGIFASIFIICLAVLGTLLFILIVKYALKYLLEGLRLCFNKNGGAKND